MWSFNRGQTQDLRDLEEKLGLRPRREPESRTDRQQDSDASHVTNDRITKAGVRMQIEELEILDAKTARRLNANESFMNHDWNLL